AGDFDAFADLGPLAAGGVGERGDDLDGLDVAGLALEGGQLVLGQVRPRVDVPQLRGRHRADLDAELLLEGEVGFEAGAVALVDDDDHAGAGEHGRAADDVVEVLEEVQALAGHAHGQGVGVVLADDGPGLAAGAGAEEGPFEEDDPAGAAAGQAVGDAGADDAAAHDEQVTGVRHEGNPFADGGAGLTASMLPGARRFA